MRNVFSVTFRKITELKLGFQWHCRKTLCRFNQQLRARYFQCSLKLLESMFFFFYNDQKTMCVLHGPMTNRELSWDCNTPELNRTFSISQVFVLILLPATSLFHLREKTLDKSHNTQPVWHQRTNRQSEATSLWTKRNMSCVFFSEVAGDQNHLLRSTCRGWWVQVQQRKNGLCHYKHGQCQTTESKY